MNASKKQGWVRLHRQIEDSSLWFLEPFTKAQAWVDLFLNANHKAGIISVRGNIIPLKRGQIGWSELTMCKRWKWSKGKVRRFLKLLEMEQQIIQQKDRFITTIITIIEYNKFQADDETIQQTVKQKDSRQYINKNVKNDKNIKDCDFKEIASLKKTNVKKKTKSEFLDERREEKGKPPMQKRKPTDKQQDFVDRSKLVDYFKEAVNQEHNTKYFTHPSDIEDTKKENSKITKMIKDFWKRCDGNIEKAKAVVDWYAGEYGEGFWNYKPEGCFRKQTVVDFENNFKGKKKWL